MPQTSRTITRDELYWMVWETPMIRLAAEFGLSDNGLRKICRKLDIPCPPAGWWAKRAAGHRVSKIKLPVLRPGIRQHITISASAPQPTAMRDAIRREAGRIGALAVAERLTRPHAIIAGWIADHEERRQEARRHRREYPMSSWTVEEFTAADRRRHRLLNSLFRFLEKRGAEISRNDRGHLFAQICGEKIEFSCHEKSRKVVRPLTDREKKWETWNRSGVKNDLEPTGRFEYQIRAWTGDPFRKLWLETERTPFEALLPEIAATFIVLGPMLAERSRQREEEARLAEERRREAEIARRNQEQDDKRWRRFVQIAAQWKETIFVREFLDRLKQENPAADKVIDGLSLPDWLDWASRRAERSDPINAGAARIFSDIARVESWTRLDGD